MSAQEGARRHARDVRARAALTSERARARHATQNARLCKMGARSTSLTMKSSAARSSSSWGLRPRSCFSAARSCDTSCCTSRTWTGFSPSKSRWWTTANSTARFISPIGGVWRASTARDASFRSRLDRAGNISTWTSRRSPAGATRAHLMLRPMQPLTLGRARVWQGLRHGLPVNNQGPDQRVRACGEGLLPARAVRRRRAARAPAGSETGQRDREVSRYMAIVHRERWVPPGRHHLARRQVRHPPAQARPLLLV